MVQLLMDGLMEAMGVTIWALLLLDRTPLNKENKIQQDFGFLDPDPQKYADPQIRIQKLGKKTFTPKTQLRTFEKKRL